MKTTTKKQKICSRGHKFQGSGSCPICWPGRLKKKAAVKTKLQSYTKLHNDGSVWAKGSTLNGKAHGFWKWFRKNGVKMRSGYFDKGKQTGKWTTYDQKGQAFKVTIIK